MVDLLKRRGITAMFTSITGEASNEDPAMSSLIDCWLQLRNVEAKGERNRALHIVKSRGMAHSNQVREYVISDEGVDILDVLEGPEGVLVGRDRRVREETP